MPRFLGLSLVVTLSVAAGYWCGHRAGAEAARGGVAPPVAVAAVDCAGDRGQTGTDAAALIAAVRSAVRDELSAAREATRPAAAPSASEATAAIAAAAPEKQAARAEGRSLLEAARAAGRWTDDDADTYRGILTRLDDAGREEALLALTRAVNVGELSVETRGPLL